MATTLWTQTSTVTVDGDHIVVEARRDYAGALSALFGIGMLFAASKGTTWPSLAVGAMGAYQVVSSLQTWLRVGTYTFDAQGVEIVHGTNHRRVPRSDVGKFRYSRWWLIHGTSDIRFFRLCVRAGGETLSLGFANKRKWAPIVAELEAHGWSTEASDFT